MKKSTIGIALSHLGMLRRLNDAIQSTATLVHLLLGGKEGRKEGGEIVNISMSMDADNTVRSTVTCLYVALGTPV